jgi:phasin
MKETKTAAKQADKTGAEQVTEVANAAAAAYREFAERGVQQAKVGYDRFRMLAEDATATLEDSYAAVSKAVAELNLSALAAAQENANAAFDLARNLVNVTSFSEALELQIAYVRQRFEARIAQAKELVALASKVANDGVRPVHEGFAQSAA